MLDAVVLAPTLAFAVIVNAQVNLRTAYTFAVLAGTSVTNNGLSLINGSVGVAPGTTVTGFPLGIISNGAIHSADAAAYQAQAGVANAYLTAARLTPNAVLTGQDLGGMTLTAGVYFFSGSASLTGTLTLDGQGNPNSTWVFQVGSTLTTTNAATMLLTNGGSPCNVYWQVGSSASIGISTAFVGNILALTSISANSGASFKGGLYARNGAVTLFTNAVRGGLTCPATTPTCMYKQLKCGYNLSLGQGYNDADLTYAVNATGETIPPLVSRQLNQVLYSCNDTYNHIVGNSFCFAGCITMPPLYNDQCAM